MIIVRLRGGLGNQLFQFAAGYALAKHHSVPLKFDLYYYKKHSYRKFELNYFTLPVEIASRQEVHGFTGPNPVKRFINKRENYLRAPKVFVQPYYHFYDDYFKLPAPLYINGYFQSEKYFAPVKDQVIDMMKLATYLDERNKGLASQLTSCNSVSFHIRRGDYTKGVYGSFFGGLKQNYYDQAIEIINASVPDAKFFIFSDDMAWCKANLNIKNATYVDHNKGSDAYKDLYMMSQCKHNIMANSSFSWWGAYLNKNPDKIVIAPQQWFQHDYVTNPEVIYPCRIYNTKDLIPSTWKRI